MTASAPSFETVHARQGETVDALVWRVRGAGSGAVEAVLEANPGLAGLGQRLADGTPVRIPAVADRAAETAPLVQLWS